MIRFIKPLLTAVGLTLLVVYVVLAASMPAAATIYFLKNL